MSKNEKISKEEAKWRAEDDARAVRAYAELVKDKARMAAAKKKLKEQQIEIDKAIRLTK